MKIYLILYSSLLLCFGTDAQQITADRVQTAIRQLDSENSNVSREAAEFLAEKVKLENVSPIKKRLETESEFDVKLALQYAIASQGEKSAIKPLIESLGQSGHMGSIYLQKVTGCDFGWDAKAYTKWFDRITDKEFKDFIDRHWQRKPMMDEYAEFSTLYYRKEFYGLKKSEREDSNFPDIPFTEEDKRKLKTLPTAKAWMIFESGLTELQENGNRKEAARLFRRVSTEYGNTYYADQCRELAELLDRMVIEDLNYKRPKNVEGLDAKARIEFHIHNLRDVVAYQISQPGYCHVLNSFSKPSEKKYNAAIELRKIGAPAIPYLMELLEDRRPIRSVGYWRHFRPDRTVLRYQDAAIQIIDAIRSKPVYDRSDTGSYFSTEKPEKRKAIINALRAGK